MLLLLPLLLLLVLLLLLFSAVAVAVAVVAVAGLKFDSGPFWERSGSDLGAFREHPGLGRGLCWIGAGTGPVSRNC